MCKTQDKLIEIKEYIRQWAGIKTASDIAFDMEVSKSYVLNLAVRMGISVELKKKVEGRKLMDELILNKGSEMSAREISELVHVASVTVRNRANFLGVRLKQLKLSGRKKIRTYTPGMFVETERSNWLI